MKRRAVLLTAAGSAGVLLTVGLLSGWATGGSSSTLSYVDGSANAIMYKTGHQPLLPDFSGSTFSGSHFNLSQYRGKVVVINTYADWCGPCNGEAPILKQVAQQYVPQGVHIFGVDEREPPASGEAFTRRYQIPYPSLSDPSSQIMFDFTSVVPATTTPTTLVVGPDGHIRGAVFGATTYGELATILDKVMGKATS